MRIANRLTRLGGTTWRLVMAAGLICFIALAGLSSATAVRTDPAVTWISSWHWDSGYGQQRILADSSHRTLYVYCVMGRHIRCKNAHKSANRRPLIAHGRVKAGAGVDQSKLRTRRLSDGERQVTYYGQPLYLYTRDGQPYKVQGETWAARCGTRQWNVIRTNGEPVTEPLKCGTPF